MTCCWRTGVKCVKCVCVCRTWGNLPTVKWLGCLVFSQPLTSQASSQASSHVQPRLKADLWFFGLGCRYSLGAAHRAPASSHLTVQDFPADPKEGSFKLQCMADSHGDLRKPLCNCPRPCRRSCSSASPWILPMQRPTVRRPSPVLREGPGSNTLNPPSET